MRRTIGLAVCVLLIAAEGKDKDKKADPLTGTWKVVSLVAGGQDMEKAKGNTVTFKDGTMTMKSERGDRKSTYKLDSSKKPAAIDLTAQGGQRDGMTSKGIYEVKDDELKLCVSFVPGGARPGVFASKDQGEVLFTLKREKGDAAEKTKEKGK